MIVPWTEIEGFHNIRKYAVSHPEILKGNQTVLYRSKVKIHGTNAGVQVHQDGRVVPQSRTTELSLSDDNAGFARWVESQKTQWQQIPQDTDEDMIIFGEWCGPGVQKGVAVCEIPKKSFVVFAAKNLTDETFIVEPRLLQNLVKGISDVYVLPWRDQTIEIDWLSGAEDLQKKVEEINRWVAEIEAVDPWVEGTFGIKGTGEGLVFYPYSSDHLGYENFKNLVFKAKGEAHKNIKTAAPAQVNPEVAESVNQFVDMVLTTARLEQGAAAVSSDSSLSFDMKCMGKFLTWIANDVQKETADELEASNLTWKQVQKTVAERARQWYLERFKLL